MVFANKKISNSKILNVVQLTEHANAIQKASIFDIFYHCDPSLINILWLLRHKFKLRNAILRVSIVFCTVDVFSF